MKYKIKLAVTRILSLHTEFTSGELSEAMQFIRERGLDDIFDISMVSVASKKKARSGEFKDKSSQESKLGASKVLADLELKDSEKYHALAAFEGLLRSGKVLTRLDGIKKVGMSIDKDFQPGKSRKDAVPKLMNVLASLSLSDINKIISKVVDGGEDSGMLDESYQNLANFLLSSKS